MPNNAAPFMLEGIVDNRDTVIDTLRADLAEARREIARMRSANAVAVGSLRRQLEPLYRALQQVFGEIETLSPDDASNHPAQPDGRTKAVWDSWKSRLGGSTAKVIDALLLQADLNTQQLAIATGLNRNTVAQCIMKINKAGLINKNGGRFSLKQI